jgi:hypothetical protein
MGLDREVVSMIGKDLLDTTSVPRAGELDSNSAVFDDYNQVNTVRAKVNSKTKHIRKVRSTAEIWAEITQVRILSAARVEDGCEHLDNKEER